MNTEPNQTPPLDFSRPAFAAVRDWREPQVITLHGLASVLADAERDGYAGVRLELVRFPAGYRVTFQPRLDALATPQRA